jgi:hypothetical protein
MAFTKKGRLGNLKGWGKKRKTADKENVQMDFFQSLQKTSDRDTGASCPKEIQEKPFYHL